MSEKFKPFEWDEKLQGIPKSKILLYDCTFARKNVLHVIPLSLKKIQTMRNYFGCTRSKVETLFIWSVKEFFNAFDFFFVL